MSSLQTTSKGVRKSILSALSAGGFSLKEISPVVIDAVRVAKKLPNSGKLVKSFSRDFNAAKVKYQIKLSRLESDIEDIREALKSPDIYSASSIIVSRNGLIEDIDALVMDIETGGRAFLERKLNESLKEKNTVSGIVTKLVEFTPDQILGVFSDSYRQYVKEKAIK